MIQNKKRATVFTSTCLIVSSLLVSSCNMDDYLGGTLQGSSLSIDEKVVLGLRTALNVGIDSSSAIASKVNGYLTHKVIKILLPPEAERALQAADSLATLAKPFLDQLKSPALQGLVAVMFPVSTTEKNSLSSNIAASNALLLDIASLSGISDSVVKYMNRAAENSATRSSPIFKEAILGMSITDGLTLLNSSDSTAATTYLNGKTFSPLVTAYTPIVDSTLALLPLTQYWGTFRTTYNSILANYNKLLTFQSDWNKITLVASAPALQVNKLQAVNYQPVVTESLGAWTTDKALTGLFYLVGGEEKKIRRDPLTYIQGLATGIGEILKEVFGEIMEMPK
jgi:Protein of unknown function (DUF4197)